MFLFLLSSTLLAYGEAARRQTSNTDDVRLVEVEVTLNAGVASSDVKATVERLVANARGIASSVDVGAHRAVIVLPASRVAGLKKEGLVRSALPAATSSGKYRLRPLKPVTMTSTPWNSGTYAYDPPGNITAIGTDTYTYDGVNRLLTSHTNGVSQNFTYDKFGNRKTADVLAGQCAGASDCALTVSVSDTSGNRLISTTKNGVTQNATYDVAGDVTGLGAVAFTWDAIGMMTSRSDALYRQFVYDANDERIGSFYEENWTWTLRDTAGRAIREYSTGTSPAGHPVWTSNDWHWHTDHIYRGDQMLASVANLNPYGGGGGTVMQHFHLDHLGTPRLVTQSAAEVAFHAYFPFGTEQAHAPVESPMETQKFAGHELDVDNGTFATLYMHARYYNSSTGQFFSVDPKLRNTPLKNPQQWNRYVYALDNPVKYLDHDGRDVEIAASANTSVVRNYLADLATRPGGRALLMGIVNDHSFKLRLTTGTLTSPALIAQAVQQRGQITPTFGQTVPDGNVKQSAPNAPGQFVVTGATTTLDPNAVSRLHPDKSGVTTIGHELNHADDLRQNGVPALQAGDVPTSATGTAEQRGQALAAEQPDMSKKDALKLVDQFVPINP